MKLVSKHCCLGLHQPVTLGDHWVEQMSPARQTLHFWPGAPGEGQGDACRGLQPSELLSEEARAGAERREAVLSTRRGFLIPRLLLWMLQIQWYSYV